MTRNTKIIIAIVVGLLLIGLCACVALALIARSATKALGEAVVTDPTEVAELTASIADFDTPAGFEVGAMNLFGLMKAVVLAGNDTSPGMIMLMQVPSGTNMSREDLERAMQQQSYSQNMQWKVVGTTTKTIRDQEVTLVTSEATDDSGNTVRSLTGTFEGKNGSIMMMIMGDADTWDENLVDEFLQSIR